MTDKVQKIRAEIERLRDSFKAISVASPSKETTLENIVKAALCKQILSFIDSMQEEPVSKDLEQAIDTYLSTYFGGEKEKQDWPFLKKMAIHFAEWQKQKDAEAINENALLYNARLEGIEIGKAEMKQQLMKDTVDGWIEEPECLLWRVISDDLTGEFVVKNKLQDGDKVKIVIVKSK